MRIRNYFVSSGVRLFDVHRLRPGELGQFESWRHLSRKTRNLRSLYTLRFLYLSPAVYNIDFLKVHSFVFIRAYVMSRTHQFISVTDINALNQMPKVKAILSNHSILCIICNYIFMLICWSFISTYNAGRDGNMYYIPSIDISYKSFLGIPLFAFHFFIPLKLMIQICCTCRYVAMMVVLMYIRYLSLFSFIKI